MHTHVHVFPITRICTQYIHTHNKYSELRESFIIKVLALQMQELELRAPNPCKKLSMIMWCACYLSAGHMEKGRSPELAGKPDPLDELQAILSETVKGLER